MCTPVATYPSAASGDAERPGKVPKASSVAGKTVPPGVMVSVAPPSASGKPPITIKLKQKGLGCISWRHPQSSDPGAVCRNLITHAFVCRMAAPRGGGAMPNGPALPDLDRQCGVPQESGMPCPRSLTCKAHSLTAKRSVQGRSRPYDELREMALQAASAQRLLENGGVGVDDGAALGMIDPERRGTPSSDVVGAGTVAASAVAAARRLSSSSGLGAAGVGGAGALGTATLKRTTTSEMASSGTPNGAGTAGGAHG